MPIRVVIAAVVLAGLGIAAYWLIGTGSAPSASDQKALVDRYCTDCHNPGDFAGNLSLVGLDLDHVSNQAETWEKVIRKLRVGMMPPADAAHPPPEQRRALIRWLESSLDEAANGQPDPGSVLPRRLNRAEYAYAIRDLLHLDVDASTLLPPNDSAYGFDNNAEALGTSPVLVEQYLSAAGKIASLAIGDPDTGAAGQTFRIRPDASQNVHIEGMPIGTVGGGMAHVVLPLDGSYRLNLTYIKSNLGAMKGLELPHQVEIAVDGERVHVTTIGGPEDFEALKKNYTAAALSVEARSSTTVPLTAGPHDITVGFVHEGATQGSARLQQYLRSTEDNLDPTGHPHIDGLTVTGPYDPAGPGDTPSRRRIFTCFPEPGSADEVERACASEVLTGLARRAYRGDATQRDLENLMAFYDRGYARRGFEGGIQTAIERLLASPKFTFRVERDTETLAPGAVHAVSDRELASRLSFFLWSSIPDDELLDLAERDELSNHEVLEAQARRMLADPKARALVDDFAGQWLYLRNLEGFVPNHVGFPNFDDNLRQGLRTETQLFFESVVREDRSVLDLMTADYTFLNERVAKHYGVPGVYGSHFRRVALEDERRWGLLGKGSVLLVSSHTDRTSPVVRGKWVLDNLLGAPPPAPPGDVPPLEDVDPQGTLTVRERLQAHRANPVCASCHAIMDPIGFALENFDAVGHWRDYESGIGSAAIDASGQLLDGTAVNGPIDLRRALVRDPEIFVSTVVEKLMIYALGRGLSSHDMPVVRQIVRDASENNYEFSAIVLGIIESVPFRMREKPVLEAAALAGERR
jgi:hypothetical protein